MFAACHKYKLKIGQFAVSLCAHAKYPPLRHRRPSHDLVLCDLSSVDPCLVARSPARRACSPLTIDSRGNGRRRRRKRAGKDEKALFSLALERGCSLGEFQTAAAHFWLQKWPKEKVKLVNSFFTESCHISLLQPGGPKRRVGGCAKLGTTQCQK